MAMLFANDYSGLAQQRNFYDQLNTNLQLAQAKQAQDNYQFQAAQQVATQRQFREDQRQANDEYFRYVQSQQEARERAAAAQQAQYQFNAGLAEQKTAQAEKVREFDKSAQLTEQANADNSRKKSDSETQAKQQQRYQDAQGLIQSGAYDNRDKLLADFSDLQPQQLQTLGLMFDTQQRQLNTRQQALYAAQSDKANILQMTHGDKAPTPQELAAYDKLGVSVFPGLRTNSMGNVSTNYLFHPVTPTPTPAPAPVNRTNAVPPMTVPAPSAPGATNAPATPSAPLVTMGRQPMGGYLVGAKYKLGNGSATYLGGNPNDPTSWQQN